MEYNNYMLQSLVNNFVRPPRWTYSLCELGPSITQLYHRTDSQILNFNGLKIDYSYYENRDKSNTCLIYAHCNSGCRIEGMNYVEYFLAAGWNVLLFDFAGCGVSGGDTISLGYRESADLALMVAEARRRGNRRVVLWGRSMGASTILRYLQNTPKCDHVCACVLDSPFSSLRVLAREAGEKMTGLPSFVVSGLLSLLDSYIAMQENFSISQLDLIPKMHKIQCPIVFIASSNDSTTGSHHSQALYDACIAPKLLEYIAQDHNHARPESVVFSALMFCKQNTDKPKSRIFVRQHNSFSLLSSPIGEGEGDNCADCQLFSQMSVYELVGEPVIVRNPLRSTFRSAITTSLGPYAQCLQQVFSQQSKPRKKIFG